MTFHLILPVFGQTCGRSIELAALPAITPLACGIMQETPEEVFAFHCACQASLKHPPGR